MPEPAPTLPAPRPAAPVTRAEVVRPLDAFYAAAGQPLPPWQAVDGESLPQPFRRLLVHADDMTPTLEAFYGQTIHIHALQHQESGDEYSRLVVLHLDGSEQPVEFGANRIHLALFPEEAQRQILEEHQPLGHILRDFHITHTCEPDAFLRVASDRIIDEALQLRGAHVLYGRHNRLFDPQRRLLSEVVEILAAPVTRTTSSLP